MADLTTSLRQQHAGILEAMDALTRSLGSLPEGSDAVLAELSDLAHKLSDHWEMESLSLYPHIADYPDTRVRLVAGSIKRRCEGLEARLASLRSRWSTSDSIAERHAAFTADALPLFYAVRNRIRSEDTDLFPLLEQG